MTTVIRLGPLPLQRRRASRVAELERILGKVVQLVEVFSVAELVTAVEDRDAVAVALDAPQPGGFTEAVAAAGSLPVLRPLWRRQRNARGEIDEVFDGYGLLTATGVARLGDGELSSACIAFLVITHDLDMAGAVAEQVAVMQRGRIVECGPTPKVSPRRRMNTRNCCYGPQPTSVGSSSPPERNGHAFDYRGQPRQLERE